MPFSLRQAVSAMRPMRPDDLGSLRPRSAHSAQHRSQKAKGRATTAWQAGQDIALSNAVPTANTVYHEKRSAL